MKTITFFKRILASAALVSVCGFACATNNGKQFIHNDTMEGGKLVCREICNERCRLRHTESGKDV